LIQRNAATTYAPTHDVVTEPLHFFNDFNRLL
jgi:hypothetical protein